jgi:c-di-GMP-binding flagellar brake protein YcgR
MMLKIERRKDKTLFLMETQNMSAVNLKLDQKIYVYKPYRDEQYVSVVEEIGEDTFSIAIPLSQSSPLAARAGDTLKIKMTSQAHSLEFTTQVVRIKLDNVPLYVLRYPDRVKRVQLRKDVRFDILMDIFYCRPPGNGNQPDYKKAVAVNISAGGMKLSVPEQIAPGEIIMMKFSLPVKSVVHEFQLKAKVVRCQADDVKRKKTSYNLGLLFTDINNAQKDTIYQYIFNKMSEMRRAGKA